MMYLLSQFCAQQKVALTALVIYFDLKEVALKFNQYLISNLKLQCCPKADPDRDCVFAAESVWLQY